jgi:integrase/recombinase XerD
MTSFIVPAGAGEDAVSNDVRLHLAAAAYLARFKGLSREHTDSDLRAFLSWCARRDIDPLRAQRAQLELYVRWMQETRRYKPSTVSRRTSVLSGLYRTAVIDGVLAHSPAEYVRRPTVPPESPTLGLTHLQFEAMLTAARESANLYNFALVAMLGLLGLRIFEATGTDVTDLGEETGTGCCGWSAKAPESSSCPCLRPWDERWTGRWTPEPPGRSCSTPVAPGWTATPPPDDCGLWPPRPGSALPRMHPHMLRHTFVTTMQFRRRS